ncbi:MAG TPA: hypothetical protein VFU49_23605 [Ktedonobacteraceae bacterium]|nr:hypothetical protein [Ktedonobacteraceae bacterium]
MKKAEQKPKALLANLGDLNRPLRVRSVRYMGREWWAIDSEDTWPGMVMDLRRLGFESIAMGEEVLVRENGPLYESKMDSPIFPEGLKPFPEVHPTIRIRKESYASRYDDSELTYLDEYDEEDDVDDELEPEDLDDDE